MNNTYLFKIISLSVSTNVHETDVIVNYMF